MVSSNCLVCMEVRIESAVLSKRKDANILSFFLFWQLQKTMELSYMCLFKQLITIFD